MPLILVTILAKYRLRRESCIEQAYGNTHTHTSAHTHTTDKTQSPTVIPERLITWSFLKVLSLKATDVIFINFAQLYIFFISYTVECNFIHLINEGF